VTDDLLRDRLIERIRRLPQAKLLALERFLGQTEPANLTPAPMPCAADYSPPRDWPHAPVHRISEHGTCIVTAGTLNKQHHFHTARRLDLLEGKLLELARQYGWHLEAWAVFSNHYHFVGHSGATSGALNVFLGHLHSVTAAVVNEEDETVGRQVWYNYWDKQLTYERSYFARLHYVHQNPVKHGLVRVASQYRWCSAAWFERTARPAQVKTIYSFKTDKLRVFDDFEVVAPLE